MIMIMIILTEGSCSLVVLTHAEFLIHEQELKNKVDSLIKNGKLFVVDHELIAVRLSQTSLRNESWCRAAGCIPNLSGRTTGVEVMGHVENGLMHHSAQCLNPSRLFPQSLRPGHACYADRKHPALPCEGRRPVRGH